MNSNYLFSFILVTGFVVFTSVTSNRIEKLARQTDPFELERLLNNGPVNDYDVTQSSLKETDKNSSVKKKSPKSQENDSKKVLKLKKDIEKLTASIEKKKNEISMIEKTLAPNKKD